MFETPNHIIVMSSDMNRSITFYKETLGLTSVFESENWSEFKMGQINLALHSGAKPQDKEVQGDEPHSEKAGQASISFDVKDLDEVFQKLSAKGVLFSLEPTLREDEGIRLAIACDPDGFEICFAQRI